MNRERIEKHIKDIIDSETGFIDERETVKEITANDIDKIAQQIFDNIIKRHEQDTLKEFVEWQAKQYKDLYYEYDKETEEVWKTDTDYFWCSGRVAGIGEIRKRLKKDLENFIKEREK